MPVEVRELIIRARVVNDGGSDTHSFGSATAQSQSELVAACVEQVLKILERRKER